MNFEWVGWCKQEGHDKVWAIMPLQDGRFATVWGRRGKTLQSKVQDGWDRRSLIRSKCNKGYQQITPSQLNVVYPNFREDLEKTALWLLLAA